MSAHATPTTQDIVISVHAGEQYRDRVKPHLEIDEAVAELERIKHAGSISSTAPEWAAFKQERPFYLLIGADYVLPLRPIDGGRWRASTVLVTSTISEGERHRRRQARADGRPPEHIKLRMP